MEKYLVKIVSVAKPDNPTYTNEETHTYYYGKGDKLVGAYDCDPWVATKLNAYMIEEYGYSRLCDAKRNWGYRNHRREERYWTSRVEIIKINMPLSQYRFDTPI